MFLDKDFVVEWTHQEHRKLPVDIGFQAIQLLATRRSTGNNSATVADPPVQIRHIFVLQ